MPPDKPRIDVFISSTSIDLPEHRRAVEQAILSLEFFPQGMEHWPVSGENPVELCRGKVNDSEIYLGIYAHRYGWRPEGDAGLSITELEYDWAGEVKRDGKPIPRLCFIMKDDHPWPKDKMELEADAELQRFKAKVKAHQVGFFTTPDDLKAQVTAALANIQREYLSVQKITWVAGAGFDNYKLRRVLGEGGNGQVWLADEMLPNGTTRPVAIKVLRPEISANPKRVERFVDEISNMARIDHPYVVNILTHGRRSDQMYVVMRYVPGGTLRQRLSGKPLPEAQALRYLEQIGAALDHVYERGGGLIHRDVKPENILLSEDGETAYLSDFGLVFSSDDEESLSEDGKLVGTGRYMAPEQWRRERLTHQTDLYALGILAYEMYTGHLPFQYRNDLDLGNAHVREALPADPHLPDEVRRIVAKAAAKLPAERYPTARAFLGDLRNWREDPANSEPRIRDYLNWVTQELYESLRAQFIELEGDKTTLRVAPVVFKPRGGWADEDDLFARASAARTADHIEANEEGKRQFLDNVRGRLLELDRTVLIGEPGSGKTWMLQRMQADCARAVLEGRGNRVPVLVRLNQYNGGSFEEFVKTALDTLAPYHDQLRREGRLLLLCDALNEMPRGNGQMAELLKYLQQTPLFVVSCRVRDYRDDLGALKPLEQVLLHDFELPAIREIVHKRLPGEAGAVVWRQMGGTEELFAFWEAVQQRQAGEAFWEPKTDWWDIRRQKQIKNYFDTPLDWRIMHSGARLIPLARSPYLADLICRTAQEGQGALPTSRAELFGRFIGQMLSREARTAARRGEVFPDVNVVQEALIAVARRLQELKRTVMARTEAEGVIGSGGGVLLRAALDANILIAQEEEVRFSHQLLQEYFAAKILLEKLSADEIEDTHDRARALFGAEWWDAGVWRETTVILGEFLGEGARGANRVCRWLAPVSPEVALQVILRSSAGLTFDDVEDETRVALVMGAGEKTVEAHPIGRAAAYRVLGLLQADDRPGVGVGADGLPDIEWSEVIPAGEFIMGSGEDSDNPKRTVRIEQPYQIAKYPTTYKQFQAFIDADDGWNDDRWWEGLSDNEYRRANQRAPGEQAFRVWNHPRENVSWYDAIAFCRWLSFKLGCGYALDQVDKWAVRLPTEQEWERAARGTDGRIYPYEGNFDAAKGNTWETGIRQTSAVGIFPDGVSPAGALDMSGNVWEWCLTDYSHPALDATGENLTSDARRVVRGGSWDDFQGGARALVRFDFSPFGRFFDGRGFRVLRPLQAL